MTAQRATNQLSTKLDIRWVTLRFANGVVNNWHSHLPPARGHLFSLGAFDGPECVGVVIVSRPVARMLDDGRTVDVVRLCTNGYPNAASGLLGRARRVCSAMGWAGCGVCDGARQALTEFRLAHPEWAEGREKRGYHVSWKTTKENWDHTRSTDARSEGHE